MVDKLTVYNNQDDAYHINGELIIDNAMNWLKNGNMPINSRNKSISIDLSKISKIDTAGIAALLFLKSIIHKNNSSIVFVNLPEQIINLCNLYKINL